MEIHSEKYHVANANCLLPFYGFGSEHLTNDKIIKGTNLPPWNLSDENNLRSIWDYPLRRSFSDSSATNLNLKLSNNIWDSNSSVSSASSSSASSTSSSSATADSFFSADFYASQALSPSRAEIVGVIGSNRHVNDLTQKQQPQQSSYLNDINVDNISRKPLLSACLSDSNDSGYSDILTGINIANDIFNHSITTSITSNNNISLLTSRKTNSSLLNAADEAASILLLPATAETLLNESINEISRKLIETCGNEPLTNFSDSNNNNMEMPHSACFSTCSEFSNDSGIETNSNKNINKNNNLLNCDQLIFNFDNLSMNNESRTNDLLGTPSTMIRQQQQRSNMEKFLMHLNCNNDTNNNNLNDENNNNTMHAAVNNNDNNNNEQQHQHFTKNCMNSVWPNGNEEVREPTIRTMLNSMVELNTTAFSSH